MKHETEHPGKDGTPREPFVAKLKAAGVILLLFLVPALLYHVFTRYMYYCDITLPAGTTVVDYTVVSQSSPLGRYISGRSWYPRFSKWIGPYLMYRHYTIPDGATEIKRGCLGGTHGMHLRSIRIPDSVTKIDDYAFSRSGLRSISLPPGITEIPDGLFNQCSKLTDVRIPDGVTRIGDKAFCECSSLREIVLPDSVKTIEYKAFNGCSSLRRADIPDTVEIIDSSAFEDCSRLEEIRLPAGMGATPTVSAPRSYEGRRADGEGSLLISKSMFANCTAHRRMASRLTIIEQRIVSPPSSKKDTLEPKKSITRLTAERGMRKTAFSALPENMFGFCTM